MSEQNCFGAANTNPTRKRGAIPYRVVPRLRVGLVWVVLGALVSLPIGCRKNSSSSESFGDTPTLAPAQDHFSVAMNFFRRVDELDPGQARKQVFDNLNRWIEDQPADEGWQPDPLVARLTAPWRDLEPLRNLGRLEFGMDDAEFLQEAAWMRDISRWVSEQPLEPWLAKRLPAERDGLSKAEIDRLGVALRLFDWTIRNIQLDELLPMPKAAAAGPSADPKKPDDRPPPPPFQAVPGPGYRHFPWQTLLMGHGDAWQRARVFILLCRQEGIDAVMLGLIEGSPSSPPTPWLPAVLIKDQLYLFDTALGLPLPGPQGRGLATLSQAAIDPKLLRQLDLNEHRYRVSAEALTQVVALVDAAPGFLSRRMHMAEARVSGDDRMVLSVAPSKLKERLSGLSGVSGVQLWMTPYETMVYRSALVMLIGQNNTARLAFYREEGPFQSLQGNPLVLARFQHFRGVFDARDERGRPGSAAADENSGRTKPSARELYLLARVSDEEITKFANSEQLARQKAANEPPEAWAERRGVMIDSMRNARQFAAFLIGLTHYERQNYPTAVDWLKRRTLDAAPEGAWAHGTRYNLARSYEALGEVSAARELYFTDESPQRHGNLLRAEWIEAPAKK